MCGIIGICGKDIREYGRDHVASMLATLAKRGPDDTGTLYFFECILGQNRLSIIDLSGGHQPMSDNERNVSISFNGEIYNYLELKNELERKNRIFTTKSDTEVILKAYITYGADCVKYLDGMFAFAIWDEDYKTLFMARDRFGKKPLYYSFDAKGNLLFASEIKALLAHHMLKGEVDMQAIDNYLQLMYIPPHKTVYKNIHTLPPAHYAVFKDGKLTMSRYWSLERNPLKIGIKEAKEELKRLIRSAVLKRMIADVEVGVLLSGGLDSTLIAYNARLATSSRLKTFAVGYEHYINELPFAEKVAEKFNTEHYTLQATKHEVDALQKVVAYFDEPHADSSDISQHLVSQLAHSKVKVALSGDGADELFMGYGWYWKYWNLPVAQRMWEHTFSGQFAGFLRNIQVFSPQERSKLWQSRSAINSDIFSPAMRQSKLGGVEKINLFDLTTYLPGQLLTKIDRMGMMNSLEVRCPFLDTKLAEFAYNVPVAYKMDKRQGKLILKSIMLEIMPPEFVMRRKQGFGAPVKEWLKEESYKRLAHDLFEGTTAEIYRFLRPQYVKELMHRFYTKEDYQYAYRLWVLICLELWWRANKSFFA